MADNEEIEEYCVSEDEKVGDTSDVQEEVISFQFQESSKIKEKGGTAKKTKKEELGVHISTDKVRASMWKNITTDCYDAQVSRACIKKRFT